MLVIQIINLKLADMTFSQKHPRKNGWNEPVPVRPILENRISEVPTLVVEKISG